MGIFDKLFGKKSKDSEVKKVGIEKKGVKKKSSVKPVYCDLCNKTVLSNEVVCIPLKEMQQAARDGFNPWKTPGTDMSAMPLGLTMAATGASTEQIFQNWLQRLMADTTNWNVCSVCADTLHQSSRRAPAPKIKVKKSANKKQKKKSRSVTTDEIDKEPQMKCSRCGIALFTLTEVKNKYPSRPGGFWEGTMEDVSQLTRDRDAIGLTCAVCGKNYCSACMLKYGKPHSTSGGLACLECTGHMTEFRG